MSARSLLGDVSIAYFHARQRFEQSSNRGDVDRADEALADMQIIERCVTVHESSTEWRTTRRRRA